MGVLATWSRRGVVAGAAADPSPASGLGHPGRYYFSSWILADVTPPNLLGTITTVS